MNKLMVCTGYAVAGAVVAVVGMAAAMAIVVGFMVAGDWIGSWLNLPKVAREMIGLILMLASIGAAVGAAACHETN